MLGSGRSQHGQVPENEASSTGTTLEKDPTVQLQELMSELEIMKKEKETMSMENRNLQMQLQHATEELESLRLQKPNDHEGEIPPGQPHPEEDITDEALRKRLQRMCAKTKNGNLFLNRRVC